MSKNQRHANLPEKRKPDFTEIGEDTIGKMLQCQTCGLMFYNTTQGLAEHDTFCSGKPYHCSECGLDFGRGEAEKLAHEIYHSKMFPEEIQ